MRFRLEKMYKEAIDAVTISEDETSITYWTGYADAIQRIRSLLG